MIKCIFIGDAPNKSARSRTPFVHAKCAPRLQEWIDYLIGNEDYIIVNQSDVSIVDIERLMIEHKCVNLVALGNKAYSKFKEIGLFKLPHPSGLNRQINNKAKLTIALMHCKDFLG